MPIATVDFETYYDAGYSLRKLSEADYILSPLFQVIMCAIKLDDNPTRVYVGEAAARDALAEIDWSRTAMLAHNTRFDGTIMAWRFGYAPSLYLDTMSMARAMTHPVVGSSSLANVAKFMRLPAKGDAVVRAMGKRLEDFTPAELSEYTDYCVHDTDLCRTIYDRFMRAGFPKGELRVIDLGLRMYISPQAQLDQNVLAAHLHHVQAQKAHAFAQVAHIPKDVFSSNHKFAALLTQHNVEVPFKPSPTDPDKFIPALARGDRAFKELCEDISQSPIVQALLACRINAKSTIEETRTSLFLRLSQTMNLMPVPYRYYAAITGRFGGDGGFNFANLPRGSQLRAAIIPPEGMRIVHRDSSQIEARMLAWLAKCGELLQGFREKRDIYSEFASIFYQRTITKADKAERHVGKTAILSLGYSAGPERFRHALFIGTGGVSVNLSPDEADQLVKLYRAKYEQIPRLWRNASMAIERMIRRGGPFDPDANRVERSNFAQPLSVVEEGDNCWWLPNGLALQYPELRRYTDESGYFYRGPHGEQEKLYGGKLVANVTSALARIIVMDAMCRVYARTGYHPFMSTYDSLDYVVNAADAPVLDRILEQEFAVVPAWAPGLPLASEGGFGRSLADAEAGANT